MLSGALPGFILMEGMSGSNFSRNMGILPGQTPCLLSRQNLQWMHPLLTWMAYSRSNGSAQTGLSEHPYLSRSNHFVN